MCEESEMVNYFLSKQVCTITVLELGQYKVSG